MIPGTYTDFKSINYSILKHMIFALSNEPDISGLAVPPMPPEIISNMHISLASESDYDKLDTQEKALVVEVSVNSTAPDFLIGKAGPQTGNRLIKISWAFKANVPRELREQVATRISWFFRQGVVIPFYTFYDPADPGAPVSVPGVYVLQYKDGEEHREASGRYKSNCIVMLLLRTS